MVIAPDPPKRLRITDNTRMGLDTIAFVTDTLSRVFSGDYTTYPFEFAEKPYLGYVRPSNPTDIFLAGYSNQLADRLFGTTLHDRSFFEHQLRSTLPHELTHAQSFQAKTVDFIPDFVRNAVYGIWLKRPKHSIKDTLMPYKRFIDERGLPKRIAEEVNADYNEILAYALGSAFLLLSKPKVSAEDLASAERDVPGAIAMYNWLKSIFRE